MSSLFCGSGSPLGSSKITACVSSTSELLVVVVVLLQQFLQKYI